MADYPIVVIDSGIGGLPYLARIRDYLPNESLVYVADTAHFPYGDRSDRAVRAAVLETAQLVAERLAPKMLVVACNTASVLALSHLRRRLPFPVVGVVPAVKPACATSRTGTIGVLATERTVSGRYLDRLIQAHCRGRAVARYAAGTLVRYVEEEVWSPGARPLANLAAPFLNQFKAENVDVVVLGCTHFVYLAEELSRLLGDGRVVIDSRDGVARQAARVAAEAARVSPASTASPARLYVTGGSLSDRYRELCQRFFVEPVGTLCAPA